VKNVNFRDGSVLLKQKNMWMSCSISYYELSALARGWVNRDPIHLGDIVA